MLADYLRLLVHSLLVGMMVLVVWVTQWSNDLEQRARAGFAATLPPDAAIFHADDPATRPSR
jgi:hypothetical protein